MPELSEVRKRKTNKASDCKEGFRTARCPHRCLRTSAWRKFCTGAFKIRAGLWCISQSSDNGTRKGMVSPILST